MSTYNTRYDIQTGTIPEGATAGSTKFQINAADISIDNPNFYYGPTHTPLLSFLRLTQGFSTRLSGDWSNRIKTGDPIEIQRGYIRDEYSVVSSIFDPGSTCTNILLANPPGVFQLLDSFIGTTGYNIPATDTLLNIDRVVESPNSPNYSLVTSFSTQMIAEENPDIFRLNTSWTIDPSVKVTRLRWRSVPRNINVSTLSFSVDVQGIYSQVPIALITSSTGHLAQIQLTSSLYGATVSAGGTGYTTATAIPIGGEGTGASFSVTISSGQITDIVVDAGGTGYSSVPSIQITGDGSGASAIVSSVIVSGVSIIQQGGNYLSPPAVSVSPMYLIGGTSAEISSSLLLKNLGRIDYIRVIDGGTGYTGASINITGSITADDATAIAQISNGTINNIVLTYSGHGYTGSPIITISPIGTGGTGAIAVGNVDIYSEWVYESPSVFNEYSRTLYGFKFNVPYEIEIIDAQDEHFRNLVKYTNNTYFKYYKLI